MDSREENEREQVPRRQDAPASDDGLDPVRHDEILLRRNRRRAHGDRNVEDVVVDVLVDEEPWFGAHDLPNVEAQLDEELRNHGGRPHHLLADERDSSVTQRPLGMVPVLHDSRRTHESQTTGRTAWLDIAEPARELTLVRIEQCILRRDVQPHQRARRRHTVVTGEGVEDEAHHAFRRVSHARDV